MFVMMLFVWRMLLVGVFLIVLMMMICVLVLQFSLFSVVVVVLCWELIMSVVLCLLCCLVVMFFGNIELSGMIVWEEFIYVRVSLNQLGVCLWLFMICMVVRLSVFVVLNVLVFLMLISGIFLLFLLVVVLRVLYIGFGCWIMQGDGRKVSMMSVMRVMMSVQILSLSFLDCV